MNYALTLRQPSPIRMGRLLAICIAFSLAYGISLAPTLVKGSSGSSPAKVCNCAHCPGGAKCCCRCKTL